MTGWPGPEGVRAAGQGRRVTSEQGLTGVPVSCPRRVQTSRGAEGARGRRLPGAGRGVQPWARCAPATRVETPSRAPEAGGTRAVSGPGRGEAGPGGSPGTRVGRPPSAGRPGDGEVRHAGSRKTGEPAEACSSSVPPGSSEGPPRRALTTEDPGLSHAGSAGSQGGRGEF